MKTIIAIIAASTLCCFSAQAEEAPAPAPAPATPGETKAPTLQLAKELGLSPEQTAKVKELNVAQRDKMKALQEDATLTKEVRQAKAREIRDANISAMKEVLSPEQFEKWQKIREQAAAALKAKQAQKP